MTFGAMFHHFHDDGIHHPGQGSLSTERFRALLQRLAQGFNLLEPEAYLEQQQAGGLGDRDICLSFDDALLCQYDVALPVLDEFGAKAFFFVYSSVFTEQPDQLEIYRDFRNTSFEDIRAFYGAFFGLLKHGSPSAFAQYQKAYPSDYLADFAFYTEDDRRFRFVRDQVLADGAYDDLMQALMEEHAYPFAQRRRELWMQASHVTDLAARGHEIGLHSHSHPMQMHRLSREQQHTEYSLNRRMLQDICDRAPRTMSHPCGNYDRHTLKILHDMGIRLGFRSNMARAGNGSALEMPREDHANLVRDLL